MEYYILVANIETGGHADGASASPSRASQRPGSSEQGSPQMMMHRSVFTTDLPSAPAAATGPTEGTRSRGVTLRRRSGGGPLGSSGGPGAMPHPLEEILQRAFSHVSSDSFITEFVRRTMDGQSRGNPPASKFAIENLLKDGGKNADGCAICQDDITPGCKSLQMPCQHSFHRDCLHRWLSEHNTCPVCRCEVESNCPRYNEANYNELKGKLDKVTVSNHADPSKIEPPPSHFVFGPPPSSSQASGVSPGSTRTFRMTIPMLHGGNFGWLSGNTGTPPTTARPHPGGGVDGARPRGAASRGTTTSSSTPSPFLARSAQLSSRSPRRTMSSGSSAPSRRAPPSTLLESSMDFDEDAFYGVGDSSIFSPGPFAPPFSTPADFQTLFMRSPRSPAAPASSSSSNQTRGGPRQAAAATATATASATAAAAAAAAPGRGQKRSRQGNMSAASPRLDNGSSSSPLTSSHGARHGELPMSDLPREDDDAQVGAQGARSGPGAGGARGEESNAPVARRTRRRLNKGQPQ